MKGFIEAMWRAKSCAWLTVAGFFLPSVIPVYKQCKSYPMSCYMTIKDISVTLMCSVSSCLPAARRESLEKIYLNCFADDIRKHIPSMQTFAIGDLRSNFQKQFSVLFFCSALAHSCEISSLSHGM